MFPVLGLSLYDFLRLSRFRPLFPAHIRHIAHQLLLTCFYLHSDCHVIHADIKPENILLVDSSFRTVQLHDMAINVPLSTHVRLIDFGTAVHAGAEKPSIVVSRSYRALEIVLGVGWASGVDVWAIGCVLMELYTGHRLFNIGSGSDEDHLKQMEALLGPIPLHLLAQPRVYPPPGQGSTGGGVGSATGSPGLGVGGGVVGRLRDRIVPGDVHFCDLIERMLAYDPTQRLSAQQALRHAYFLETD